MVRCKCNRRKGKELRLAFICLACLKKAGSMNLNKKILVVDDYGEFAQSLRDLLEAQGYDAMLAYSGKDAVQMIKDSSFDIVLMDIGMSGMDGVEALKEIKKISTAIVVILMTGYSVEEVVNNAIKQGALAVLNKPLDIPKLLQHFESVGNDC